MLRKIVALSPRIVGLMTFDFAETANLLAEGFDNILLGYPVGSQREADILARAIAAHPKARVWVMADLQQHLIWLQNAARNEDCVIHVCVDVDMSFPSFFGVKRSCLSSVQDVVAFANECKKCDRLKLDALMGYEAQIAGILNGNLLMRALQAISVMGMQRRRSAVVRALQERGFELSLVNGGGSGSTRTTSSCDVCTEITIGSGIYQPHLFDSLGGVPACGFVCRISRQPRANVFTASGGGFYSSGAGCKPKVWMPIADLLPHEGAGEVQTPFMVDASHRSNSVAVGNLLVLRHAKAGELLEHSDHVYFVKGKGEITGRSMTYRGQKLLEIPPE